MTFKSWLSEQFVSDDPEGDFITAAGRDPNFPDTKSWAVVEAFIFAWGKRRGCLYAGRRLWTFYSMDLLRRAAY